MTMSPLWKSTGREAVSSRLGKADKCCPLIDTATLLLKVGPRPGSMGIHWEFIRNAESQLHSKLMNQNLHLKIPRGPEAQQNVRSTTVMQL